MHRGNGESLACDSGENASIRELHMLYTLYQLHFRIINERNGLNMRHDTDAREGKEWKVADVAEALGVSSRTIEHLKERFVEGGLEDALERKAPARPPRLIFDGAFDARLTALACSPVPPGFARWTMQLLADKVVELQIAPSVSPMTVQRSLKKTKCSLT